MIQSLRSQGINADFHSVKKTDYDTLLTAIYDGRLRGYWNEILVEDELLKLRLMSNNKVDHPTKGSKDLADALAGSVFASVSHLSIENEVEIEVLSFDGIDSEKYDGLEDFENVSIYNQNLRTFVPGYRQQKIDPQQYDKWLENI
jgi:hypothetical protein